jgi:Kef-type K+ transport system membrane component KefB
MRMSSRRLLAYYAVLAAVTGTAIALAFVAGSHKHPEPNVAAVWALPAMSPDPCLGQTFVLQQSGSFATIRAAGSSGPSGELRVHGGTTTGMMTCADGRRAQLTARLRGPGRTLAVVLDGRSVSAVDTGRSVPPVGTRPTPPASIAGSYAVVPPSACVGASVTVTALGASYALASGAARLGTLAYDRNSGSAVGALRCRVGPPRPVSLVGQAAERTITLELGTASPASADNVQLQRTRDPEDLFGAFFLAIGVVMLAAQFGGVVMTRIGQPRVMGEVLAGIMLGPTLLGAVAPQVETALFPADVIPYLGVAANLGLIFYMFLVGLELDLGALRGRVAQTLAISNTGVAIPMAIGVIAAVPLYPLLGTSKHFAAFALFMGVSMSITAFPVLARILVERRLLHRPLGVLALASAAIDDVTAWGLIAVASAAAGGAADVSVPATLALTLLFVAAMAFLVRPLLARVAVAHGETGRLPVGWIVAIFAGILGSAYVTERIGVAIIFGAFVMGTIMPRHAGLTEDVTQRVESFVATLLLPLFFASTGLKTNMLLIDRPELVLVTAALCAIAILAKLGGTVMAARVTGVAWREAGVLGALMNTRGLTELIVLNLALDKGVISSALFAALVIMALLTTFMTGPLLRALDPEHKLGADAAEELEAVLPAPSKLKPPPDRKILIAAGQAEGLAKLIAVAEPLGASQPPRELIVVRFLSPTAAGEVRGGLQTESRRLQEATRELRAVSGDLASRGLTARGAALTTNDPAADLVKLAEREHVDLVLLDGRRPLIGAALPAGASAGVLERANCDVVVLVSGEQHQLPPAAGAPILVPFGGAQHDWAALELAAWLSTALESPLRLLGARRPPDASGEDGDPSRLLANASLMLQRFCGVAAEPVLADPGARGVIKAAAGVGLVVIGLSDRWRDEGLGETRAQIARAAPAPILFVRRGARPGALAGREDVTRFTWSAAGAGR